MRGGGGSCGSAIAWLVRSGQPKREDIGNAFPSLFLLPHADIIGKKLRALRRVAGGLRRPEKNKSQ